MKKVLVLFLAFMVSVSAFAATDPVFTGKFSTWWSFSFSQSGDDVGRDDSSVSLSLDLGATIDEYNTVKATVSMADALYWDDKYDDDMINVEMDAFTFGGQGTKQSDATVGNTNDRSIVEGDELDSRGRYLRLDNFTLYTDWFGAFGLDLPVKVYTNIGDFEFGSVSVANVAPNSVKVTDGYGTDGGIGIGVDIKVFDMVTLSSVWYGQSSVEGKAETGIVVKSTKPLFDILDFAAFFITSEHNLVLNKLDEDTDGLNPGDAPASYEDYDDYKGQNLGVSLAIQAMEGLKFGLGFTYDLVNNNADGNSGIGMAQLDVSYTQVPRLAIGLSYGTKDFADFAGESRIRLSVKYDILDNVGIFGAVGTDTFDFDDVDEPITEIRYDVGVTAAVGALDFILGFSNDLNYQAPGRRL